MVGQGSLEGPTRGIPSNSGTALRPAVPQVEADRHLHDRHLDDRHLDDLPLDLKGGGDRRPAVW